MRKLSAVQKNIIALSLLALPLLALLGIFTVQKIALIRLTNHELAALREIRPFKEALAVLAAEMPAKTEAAAQASALSGLLDSNPATRADTAKAQEFLSGLKDATSDTAAETMMTGADIVSTLAEQSGLTRDPRLAIDMLGDIAVTQTTSALLDIRALINALRAAEIDRVTTPDRKTTTAHKVAFNEAHDGLTAAVTNVSADMVKVMASDAGAKMSPALPAGVRALAAATDQVSAAIRAQDAAAVRAGAAAVIKAAGGLNGPLCAELESMLRAERMALIATLAGLIIVCALLTAAGCALSLRQVGAPVPVAEAPVIPSHYTPMVPPAPAPAPPPAPKKDPQLEKALAAAQENQRKARAAFDAFGRTMKERFTPLAAAVKNFEKAMGRMAALTREQSNQTDFISDTAQNATSNAESAAIAADKLAGAMADISHQAQDAGSVAAEAVKAVFETNASMDALSKNANQIGEILEMIQKIAGKTHMLALNATIEASRAGEAGQGFGVVAAEVKMLAAQTATATTNIGTQIAAIQQSTTRALSAIGQINNIIMRISQTQTAMAGAIEEQGAATRAISRHVNEAAAGSAQVTAHVQSTTAFAQKTKESFAGLDMSAHQLAQQLQLLQQDVQKFLNQPKA